jgi:membrane dipeptidase
LGCLRIFETVILFFRSDFFIRKQLEPEVKALEEKYKDDPAKLAEERRALMSKYRSAAPLPTLDDLVAHIDHVVKLVGPDYVGLGSDFDGVPTLPIGMEDCLKLPAITKALLEKGYNEKDITKILGGNLLRVFDKVAEVAKPMK